VRFLFSTYEHYSEASPLLISGMQCPNQLEYITRIFLNIDCDSHKSIELFFDTGWRPRIQIERAAPRDKYLAARSKEHGRTIQSKKWAEHVWLKRKMCRSYSVWRCRRDACAKHIEMHPQRLSIEIVFFIELSVAAASCLQGYDPIAPLVVCSQVKTVLALPSLINLGDAQIVRFSSVTECSPANGSSRQRSRPSIKPRFCKHFAHGLPWTKKRGADDHSAPSCDKRTYQ